MTKENLIALIKKHDPAVVFDIDVKYYEADPLYAELAYQIDDRIERMDKDVKDALKAELGKDYYASVERMDAFPNGYAYYKVTIEHDADEE